MPQTGLPNTGVPVELLAVYTINDPTVLPYMLYQKDKHCPVVGVNDGLHNLNIRKQKYNCALLIKPQHLPFYFMALVLVISSRYLNIVC
jgi:hypothetical protein